AFSAVAPSWRLGSRFSSEWPRWRFGEGRSLHSMESRIIGASRDVSAKFARCLSGNLAKGQSKRAVKGVAESEWGARGGTCSVRQQHLRPLNPPLKKISLRWSSEGLLEGSTKMMLAHPSEPSKRDERYSLVQVFFDVTDGSTLLPAGKAPATRW